tara:strand:+ start:828 stop:1943 length:1116 start_codon:yes stop_codon:yes gene_type:complete
MKNALKYQVRSREIIDLVNSMKSGRITLSGYFQRNLVWRDAHKRDFIDTILRGYPFPQIFIARGPIDVDSMIASTCVVDGQQRLNAIRSFVEGKFSVEGKYFSDLTNGEKEEFLKYEVPIIDFDLDAGDENLKEIFKRLNRTFYSLSSIERLATEFSSSDFMLLARTLCGDIQPTQDAIEEELDEAESDGASDFARDPGISKERWMWLLEHANGPFSQIINSDKIFSPYETSRKVPLMFVLNVMSTIVAGYYNRNLKVKENLETYIDEYKESENLISTLNNVGNFINKLELPKESMWWNKANFFTLVVELASYAKSNSLEVLDPVAINDRLTGFQASIPSDYALAAREAVNNKAERSLRGTYFRPLLTGSD